MAEFATIYPGWYSGRTVHIHMKVHIGGTNEILPPTPAVAGSFTGGHVAHTGQIFFDDAVSDEVDTTGEAYSGRDNIQRLRNDQDTILGDHADEPGFIVSLSPLVEGELVAGFPGTITIGADPNSMPEPEGFGGGPPPDGPPPRAAPNRRY